MSILGNLGLQLVKRRTGSAGMQVSSGGHKLAGAGADGNGQAHWLG